MQKSIKDQPDNRFLELAVASDADFLITGNTNDFTIDSVKKTKIVTPRQFGKTLKIKHIKKPGFLPAFLFHNPHFTFKQNYFSIFATFEKNLNYEILFNHNRCAVSVCSM
ncbi:PIN domain-containing protein [Salibacter sp.]|uniref:PIN domain-containing protein n=1 Tax=Salibacter sp. TaxID=2010995 RepID=UPI0038F7F32D